jgi:tRNA (mo5U34)-methyltransferase
VVRRHQPAEEAERLRPWFHAIELPHGVWTKRERAGTEPADHPAGTWEFVRTYLPDLAGKSVLDVGCGAGFYSAQAKRRGAGTRRRRAAGLGQPPQRRIFACLEKISRP